MSAITIESLKISALILIPLSCIPAFIAKKKGRNFFLWYIYGFGFFLPALIHSIFLPAKDKTTQNSIVGNSIEIIKDRINYFYPNSPLDLLSYVVINDHTLNKSICHLNSIAFKEIESITLNVELRNSLGQFIAETQYENLAYKDAIEFDISDYREIKSVDFELVSVMLKDGSIWTPTQEKQSYKIDILTGESAKKVKELSNSHAICIPQFHETHWVCSCGKANMGEQCLYCNMSKDKLIENFNEDILLDIKNEQIRANNRMGINPNQKQEIHLVNAPTNQKYDVKQENKRFIKLMLFILIVNIVILFLI